MKKIENKKSLAKLFLSLGLIGLCAGTAGVATYSWIKREWTPSIVGEDVKITAGSSLMFVLNNSSTDEASLVSLLGPSYKDFVLKPVSNYAGKAGEFYYVSYNAGEEDAFYSLIKGTGTEYGASYGYIEFEFSIRVTSGDYDQYVYLNPSSKIESSTLGASQAMRVAISWGTDSGGSSATTHLFRNQNRVVSTADGYDEADIGKYIYTYEDEGTIHTTLESQRLVGDDMVDNTPYVYHEGLTKIEVDEGGGTIESTPDGKSYLDDDGNIRTEYNQQHEAKLFSDFFGGIYKEDSNVVLIEENVMQAGVQTVQKNYYTSFPTTVRVEGTNYPNRYIKNLAGNFVLESLAAPEDISAYSDYHYVRTDEGMLVKSMDDKFYIYDDSGATPTFVEADDPLNGTYIKSEDSYYSSCDGKFYTKDESVTKADQNKALFIAPKNTTSTFNVSCRIWLEGCDPYCDAKIKDKLIDLIVTFDMFEDKES